MNDNGYDLDELVKFIENMKNPTKEFIESIKEKFYLSFEPRPKDYKLSGMVVIGEIGILGERIYKTFSKYYFKSSGEDAWLSSFEGIVCSNGLVILSPNNIYLDYPESILDKLTEISNWLKEEKDSIDTNSWNWDNFIKNSGYNDWSILNNLTTNTSIGISNISNTSTSTSTDNRVSITSVTNGTTGTLDWSI